MQKELKHAERVVRSLRRYIKLPPLSLQDGYLTVVEQLTIHKEEMEDGPLYVIQVTYTHPDEPDDLKVETVGKYTTFDDALAESLMIYLEDMVRSIVDELSSSDPIWADSIHPTPQ